MTMIEDKDIQDALDEFAKLANMSERAAKSRLQARRQANGKILVTDSKGELGSALYDPKFGMFD